MAEKIRPLHLPPTSTPSQQTLLVPTSPADANAQHSLPGLKQQQQQQIQGHHSQPQGSGQSDIALHTRPASSSGPGTSLDSWMLARQVPPHLVVPCTSSRLSKGFTRRKMLTRSCFPGCATKDLIVTVRDCRKFRTIISQLDGYSDLNLPTN